jgi:hypothetical protein
MPFGPSITHASVRLDPNADILELIILGAAGGQQFVNVPPVDEEIMDGALAEFLTS